MQLVVETVGEVTVAAVVADFLDASNSATFKDQIAPVAAQSRKVVIDLGRVRYIDSTGCGALLTCLKQLSAHGGDLKFCCITPAVRTLFNLVRMERVVEILATREAADEAFAKQE